MGAATTSICYEFHSEHQEAQIQQLGTSRRCHSRTGSYYKTCNLKPGSEYEGGLQYGISKDHGSLSGGLFQFMQVSIMGITSEDPDEQDL